MVHHLRAYEKKMVKAICVRDALALNAAITRPAPAALPSAGDRGCQHPSQPCSAQPGPSVQDSNVFTTMAAAQQRQQAQQAELAASQGPIVKVKGVGRGGRGGHKYCVGCRLAGAEVRMSGDHAKTCKNKDLRPGAKRSRDSEAE
jgi:hypothetical protein